MTRAPWDGSMALMALALGVLRRLRLKINETLFVILDESHTRKRAEKMAGLGYFKDPSTGGYLYGHEFLALGFWVRNFFLPAALSMYWPKKNVPRGYTFRTLNQIAAEMIESLRVASGVKVVVLFDAFFLNQTVLGAIRRRGWSWVSVAGANRKVFSAHGHRTRIGIYRRTCWRKGFRTITVRAFGREKRYWATPERRIKLSKVGPVTVVFCKAKRRQAPLALVSPQGTARQLIEHYAQRWAIELFFKESKQLLGLGHYQTRSPEGVERHLQLVSCAHLLLTHVRLNKAAREKANANIRTIARIPLSSAQTHLRYLVLCDIQRIAARKARSPRALERFMHLLKAP